MADRGKGEALARRCSARRFPFCSELTGELFEQEWRGGEETGISGSGRPIPSRWPGKRGHSAEVPLRRDPEAIGIRDRPSAPLARWT